MEISFIYIYIFKPNNYTDFQNLNLDKASMDVTLNEFRYSTNTCWDKKQEPLTIDMTKDECTGRNGLGLNSIFIPDTNHF